MDDVARHLITLGALLLVGLATDALGRRIGLPRVSLLVAFGVVAGPSALGLLPDLGAAWFPTVASLALVMIGFLLGEQLALPTLRRHGRPVFWVSIAAVVVTASVVTAGLWLLGAGLVVALLLGAIATATDPAATADVVAETRARGPFTDVLLGVVAVDDGWALLLFAVVFVVAENLAGSTGATSSLVALRELGGSVLLGLVLGGALAFLSGRVRPGEPSLLEALGTVFLCSGLAAGLGFSPILAAVTMGATVANLARHHDYPFHAIEGIEAPFMILFFIGSGASLELGALATAGSVAAAYVLLRAGGRFVGGWLGAALGGVGRESRGWMGLALMPQAGVALGMVLVAAQRFPEHAESLMPLVVATTLFFELLGPMCTRLALARAGEIRAADA